MQIRVRAALACAVFAAASGCTAPAGEKPLAPFDAGLRERTVEFVFEKIERHYPYLDRVDDWRDVERTARSEALGASTRGEFVRALGRALARLEDPHLSLELPYLQLEQERGGLTLPAIELCIVDRRLFVVDWREGEEPSPPEGAFDGLGEVSVPAPELLDIDGVPPSLGLLRALLAGDPDTPIQLGLGWPDGSRREHVVSRLPAGKTPPLKMSGSLLLDHTGIVSWARRGSLGYVRVDGFYSRKPDGSDFLAEAEACFEALQGIEHLILDLQYNGGGQVVLGKALGDYLVTEPTFLGRFQARYFGFVQGRKKLYLEPRPGGFHGPIAVLMNGQTGSMAEHLARTLRGAGRAVLIGETTVGAEAAVAAFEAPDGSILEFGRTADLGWDEDDSFQGCGIEPDVEVPLRLETLRELGPDRALAQVFNARLDAALAELDTQLEGRSLPHPEDTGRIIPYLEHQAPRVKLRVSSDGKDLVFSPAD